MEKGKTWIKKISLTVAWMPVLLICGCVSSNLQQDQEKARYSLIQLYEDQFLDNAIRVYLDLPWVQLDYGPIGGSSLNVLSGSMTATGGGTRNIFSSLAGSLIRVFNWGVSGNVANSSTRQLSISAKPVYDQPPGIRYAANVDGKSEKLLPVPSIYGEYKTFVESGICEQELKSYKNDQEFLSKNPVYRNLYRKFEGKYYYVPVSARKEFAKAFYNITLVRLGVSPSRTLNDPEGGKPIKLWDAPEMLNSLQYQINIPN